MTSGNIQMGPDPDDVLGALRKALDADPSLRDMPEEEVSKRLAGDGYLEQEPDPVLVAEMISAIDEDGGDGPGEETEAASPT